jgi:hypothetical protein
MSALRRLHSSSPPDDAASADLRIIRPTLSGLSLARRIGPARAGCDSRPWRGQISFCCVKAWISSTASSTRCRRIVTAWQRVSSPCFLRELVGSGGNSHSQLTYDRLCSPSQSCPSLGKPLSSVPPSRVSRLGQSGCKRCGTPRLFLSLVYRH